MPLDYTFKRVFLIILDGAGAGALPDAATYGDKGSNTLGNLYRKTAFKTPNLNKLGLGKILRNKKLVPDKIIGCYGKMAEASNGKDSTTGHWEMCGITSKKAFPTYPKGFPRSIIEKFSKAIGCGVLGNEVASGTEIIQRLGEEHMKTGKPIVYTSADSVFQIAAHEKIVPLKTLYKWCKFARRILKGKHAVGRVIARPFLKIDGKFIRTPRRRDFSLLPPKPTLLDKLKSKRKKVIAIGKIDDLFAHRGISEAIHTHNNKEVIKKIMSSMRKKFTGLVFANLVDFDMLFGHRNDFVGYRCALEEFDVALGKMMKQVKKDDLIVITADHGNDPTTKSTDHSREYVPLLIYSPSLKSVSLGTRKSFADLGATIAENFEVNLCEGKSFLSALHKL